MAANSGKSVKNVQLNKDAIPNKQVAVVTGGGGELEAYSVYVANVDYGCTEDELKAHFERCGRVKRLTIPKNEYGNPRGYVFVEFSDVDSVAKALAELNGSILRSREITVSRAKSNGRNWNNPNNNINSAIRLPSEQRPPRNWRSVSANPNRSSSRPPYANTNNRPIPIQQQPRSSSSNWCLNYVRATGITTDSATPNHENRDNSIQEETLMGGGGEEFDKYSVYVDNVDYWCTAVDLRTHFERCGTVNRINIPANEFGNPQGYAFVEFSDLRSADKALELNGSILRSLEITVSRKRNSSRQLIPQMRVPILTDHHVQTQIPTDSSSRRNLAPPSYEQ